MSTTAGTVFKIAHELWEFEAIHRLNYRTFVEEIPQHPANADARLVDRFHAENTYCICVRDMRLLAMVCMRSARPFSLDQKIADIERLLPAGKSLCEIRLLAVEPAFRHSRTTLELFRFLAQYAQAKGFDLGIMSGTTRQTKLYGRIGFVPFGPRVGQGEAVFQPMYLSLDTFAAKTLPLLKLAPAVDAPAIFLPGPVAVSDAVRRAMQGAPVSHRGHVFAESMRQVKRALCALTDARHVDVLLGSGTLANDMIAAQLKRENRPGMVFCNGEFGARLLDHARRQHLTFQTHSIGWGKSFDTQQIIGVLDANPGVQWLWMTHCETSTGVLNDVAAINAICLARNIALCLDCISSIGVVPVGLTHVYLASGASGKGLASYPGLSMVLRNHDIAPTLAGAADALPRYLDIGLYANDTSPFTHSSNLLQALGAALDGAQWQQKFHQLARDGAALRVALRQLGHSLVADDTRHSPAVVTLALAETTSSVAVGEALERRGFFLSYRSGYLRHRNWLQICLMGWYSPSQLLALPGKLDEAVRMSGTVAHEKLAFQKQRLTDR